MTALPEVLEKLESCPFCGREARLVDLAGFEVLCDCGASMVTGPTRVEAITAWNTRPALLRDAGDAARWRKLVALPVVVECEELGWKYWHDEPRCQSLAERVDAAISANNTENTMKEDASWHSGTEPPQPMTCDETGCTTGLVLVIHAPEDGGPNVRQGRYDHCLRGFFDSTTAQRIEPDRWTFAPSQQAAMHAPGGAGGVV